MGSTTRQLVLVTGLSGGGKSTALRALEDLGFYCVDNLPAGLLPDFVQQVGRRDHPEYARIALGVDARSPGQDLGHIPGWLDEVAASGVDCRLVFLTADTKAIIKRFSETRRRHPLTSERQALPRAIEQERALLAMLEQRADWVIDTTESNIHQLRQQVWKFAGGDSDSMTVVLESFAFKRGVPQDVDFIFDARILPNPHWVEALRVFSGLDQPVRDWLERDESVKRLVEDVLGFLKTWLPAFQLSQRSYVTIGVGCTGGQHRSVYLVDRLAAGAGDLDGLVHLVEAVVLAVDLDLQARTGDMVFQREVGQVAVVVQGTAAFLHQLDGVLAVVGSLVYGALTESMLGLVHGRGQEITATIGGTRDGRVLGFGPLPDLADSAVAGRYTFTGLHFFAPMSVGLLAVNLGTVTLVLAISLLIIVLSVMNGFDKEMRERILALVGEDRPQVPDGGALVVAPHGRIVEQLAGDPVDRAIDRLTGEEEPETLWRDLDDAIRAAAGDERLSAPGRCGRPRRSRRPSPEPVAPRPPRRRSRCSAASRA